ncbi:MAG: N-acetylmuramoyl-L-alanine amidase [Solidesulfovibrio sp.]|uniref:N-acetylmuramoyl-L-alanine amidase family protein n=1 Tax=Solidesulfovibrio sp. TaxID=2910990 RepID=UPI002B1F0F43|nr:N-acetylmuramoyl-L-alanine amidase [Solidesulfovibrio sp.]MEA4856456.1 N-acetylmuramoyl-L-alanine amidase [Solidesulfovibrio sp.]
MASRRLRLIPPLLALAAALAILPAAAGAQCRQAGLAVAVDAGHGPKAPGATSARGLPEYGFNRRLAGQVVAALRAAGFPRAFLLDPDGRDLPPAARAARANAAGAGLLVSIHHDAVQPRYLETWTVDGQPRRFCDRFAGYSLFYSGRNPFAAQSLELARAIGRELTAAGLPFTRHHAEAIPGEGRPLVDDSVGVYRYDGLAVLAGARAPAVLVEAGVIVNRAEEAELAGAARQEQTARAVAKGVERWCAAQNGR